MLCQVSSETTYQRLHHQKLCLITSDSDTCSECRFVRRIFSATMIEIHHHLTTQKLENQPYPQNSNVSTIVRTFYLKWTNLHFQVWSYTKVTGYGSKLYYYQLAKSPATNSNSRRSTPHYK
ncbi:hypothetical protein QL285_014413 [Trifolium repens]|nr:hypothetical protein QL285_014413 [Trifolium repens]